jgi:hypothetical protein
MGKISGTKVMSDDDRNARVLLGATYGNDVVIDPEKVKLANEILTEYGVTTETFHSIGSKRKNQIIRDMRRKVRILKDQIKPMNEKIAALKSQLADHTMLMQPATDAQRVKSERNEWGDKHTADTAEIDLRLSGELRLEKPQGSSLHHLIDCMKAKGHTDHPYLGAIGKFESFIVEHDWAEAFKGAEDFDGGDFRLPFDNTCFEFRVNGLRLLMLMGYVDEQPYGMVATGINHEWYVNSDRFKFEDGRIKSVTHGTMGTDELQGKLLEFIGAQVRAVCIMLDAEVAISEVTRAPLALNQSRIKKGKAPLRDYHVVSLSKRTRTVHDGATGEGGKKRMHFRRGHWRHYIDHRTWIKWMLVGNEDLGFVDKHYKL